MRENQECQKIAEISDVGLLAATAAAAAIMRPPML
jgi:hypothetical protein